MINTTEQTGTAVAAPDETHKDKLALKAQHRALIAVHADNCGVVEFHAGGGSSVVPFSNPSFRYPERDKAKAVNPNAGVKQPYPHGRWGKTGL